MKIRIGPFFIGDTEVNIIDAVVASQEEIEAKIRTYVQASERANRWEEISERNGDRGATFERSVNMRVESVRLYGELVDDYGVDPETIDSYRRGFDLAGNFVGDED
jgi:hypothetical protein